MKIINVITIILTLTCLNIAQVRPQPSLKEYSIKGIKKLTNHRIFKFNIGDTIGYKKLEDWPEFASAHSILLDGDYIYVGDNAFHNIKRINIKTGEIISNTKGIIEINDWIDETGMVNGHLFVLTGPKGFYEFNHDLSLIKKYDTPLYATSEVYLFINSTNYLEFRIYREPGIHSIKVTKDYDVKFDVTKMIIDQAIDQGLKENKFKNKGKYCRQVSENGKYYLLNEYSAYELVNNIKYDNDILKNLDFGQYRIVYFELTKRQMVVHVLEYE